MNQSKNYLEVPPAWQESSPVASVSERPPAACPPPHPWQPPPPLHPPRLSALRRGLSVQVWPGSGLCLVPCPGRPPAERRLSGGTAGPRPEASGCPRSRVACPRYSGLSRWTSLEEVRETESDGESSHQNIEMLTMTYVNLKSWSWQRLIKQSHDQDLELWSSTESSIKRL